MKRNAAKTEHKYRNHHSLYKHENQLMSPTITLTPKNIRNSTAMTSITSTALSDIIRLFVLSAKQGDATGLPDADYLTLFFKAYAGKEDPGHLLFYYKKLISEIELRDYSKPFVITMSDSVKSLHIARGLSSTLDYEQKIALEVLLMEQARDNNGYSETRMEMAHTVGIVLGIDKTRVGLLIKFLFLNEAFSVNDPNFLYASKENLPLVKSIVEIKHHKISGLNDTLIFYGISENLVLFRTLKQEPVSINGQLIGPVKCYTWKPGDELMVDGVPLDMDKIKKEIFASFQLKPVLIPKTQTTPEIIFQPSEGNLFFSGSCVPENAIDFFNPLILWVEKFLGTNPPLVTIHFKLDFFNTISSKLFLEFLKRIEKKLPEGSTAKVKWYHEEDDEDIMEAGENYAYIIKIPFEMVVIYPAEQGTANK